MPSRPRRNLSLDSADARRVRRRRQTESEDETNVRLQSQRQAQQQRRVATVQQNIMRSDWCSLKDTAFNYDPVIEYSKHPMVDIGSMNKECFHCSALKWKSETLGMCCSNGKINLQPIAEPPEPLKTLLNGETDNSKHFLKNIRKYNSCFQMTSFGADNEVHHGGFQPTFIVQGQIYHTIGSLLPMPGEHHKFLQIYFMGDQDNQANQRTNNKTGVRHEIVVDIQRMLLNHNLLINQFKTALQNMPSENFNVVIHADRTPVGRHPGTFNAPTSNDVAVVIAGNVYGTRDIVLKKHDDSLMRVPDTHRFYDALQYPLIFWQGQEGYYFNIPQVNPQTKQPLPNKKVSSMDFYAFHLMFRRDHHVILTFCQLLHQFAVDMYVKVESERLRYITLHQSNLRAESYIHLQDALASDSNIAANDLGQMVILPSSFVNSPRYLAEYTQDAFTYVRKYGRPDLFITFTCNPTWPEIIRELLPGQKHTDRHDLTARVFKQKLNKLIHVIIKGNTFGETAAYMYSVEWQKRELYNVICAELPDPSIDPELSAVVSKNMIHGPCGALNQGSPCMKDGVCSKKFPRQLINETKTNENGYPLYRRRAPANNGLTTTIRMKNSVEVTIDNSWVVPYSPLLCKMFGAHINVESCSSVKAIKYICKYINKGNDAAIFNLQGDNVQRSRDEVKNFQTGRYVSSNEAFWGLFHFSLHERDPPVIHLAVHLESGERIYFTELVNLQELVRNPPKTTLTGFFQLCTFDNFAKTLTYNELPKYYTWDKSRKNWNRRRQGMPVAGWPGVKEANVLGRIYTVSAVQFECFCVRLLLHHVRGPTSFQSLKTVNGTVYNSYREACETLGLLENDNHWCVTMEEAILCRSAVKLRQLFAIIISTCGVSNPRSLWNSYKDHLSEDILNRLQNQNNGDSESIAYNEALILIENSVLSMCGKHLGDFDMERPQQIPNANILLQRELSYNHITLNKLVCSAVPTLIPEQKTIFDYVIEKVNNCEESVIFVDAPGRTGKTHLLNLLLAEVRRHGQIAVAIASSGIAATLLEGGRTAHSVLKLPLDLSKEEKPTCNIAKSSQRGEMFRQCKLLVWDEATMTNKKSFEALDLMLQDIRLSYQEASLLMKSMPA